MSETDFIEIEDGFYIDREYAESFKKSGLISIDDVFEFEGDDNLTKSNLAKHRSRICFRLADKPKRLYLKRYDRVPVVRQIKNWIGHGLRASTSDYDRLPARELNEAGIGAPRTVAYGSEWGRFFEKRSFMVMEEVEGVSLEKELPECFEDNRAKDAAHMERCEFINRLADFTRKFHDTGYRHRDYYLCHIFLSGENDFCLIDLHRSFKPGLFSERYRLKDITQLHYSSPGGVISDTDRIRFYLRYRGKDRLDELDRKFLRKVRVKAWRIALHDLKHGRKVPFAS